MVKRTVITQLASVGEGALGRTFSVGMQLKDRVQGMMAAITELDDRVAALEKRVDALETPAPAEAAAAEAPAETPPPGL